MLLNRRSRPGLNKSTGATFEQRGQRFKLLPDGAVAAYSLGGRRRTSNLGRSFPIMMFTRFIVFAVLFGGPIYPAQFKVRFQRNAQSIGTRNRIHVNSLITEKGTVEIEAAASWSETGDYISPILLKYAPGHRIEYSVGFDSAHPGNDVTVAANTLLYDGEHWNFALGPNVTFVRHEGDGLRAGATFIARYGRGLASAGGTLSWSKATHPNNKIPSNYTSCGFGGGVRLAKEGRLSNWTVNGNITNEHASSTRPVTSLFEGLEWQVTPRLSLNFVVQQLDLRGPYRDNQSLVGLTLNVGRVWRR
jgi:hypothetical protein